MSNSIGSAMTATRTSPWKAWMLMVPFELATSGLWEGVMVGVGVEVTVDVLSEGTYKFGCPGLPWRSEGASEDVDDGRLVLEGVIDGSGGE